MTAGTPVIAITGDIADGGSRAGAVQERSLDVLCHTYAEYGIVMCLAGSVEVLYEGRREFVRSGEILISALISINSPGQRPNGIGCLRPRSRSKIMRFYTFG